MQALADGYFILPYTIQNYLADQITVPPIPTNHPEFEKAEQNVRDHIKELMSINGKYSVDHFHRELGKIMWNKVGIIRNRKDLQEAIEEIRALRDEFWKNVRIPGSADGINAELEKANRVADFFELAEIMAIDALHREESCGGHFREEYQTEEGEALRRDDEFMYVAAWEYTGDNKNHSWELNKEPIVFEETHVKVRNYKVAK